MTALEIFAMWMFGWGAGAFCWWYATRRDEFWSPNGVPPPPGTWCWVTNGEDVWYAQHQPLAANGWTNTDTWEDFNGDVRWWQKCDRPPPPPLRWQLRKKRGVR